MKSRKYMRKSYLLVAAAGWFTLAAGAQIPQIVVTNVPPTELQAFEDRTGTVIVAGAGQVGAVAVGDLNLAVVCKESMDVSGGPRQYGLAIEITDGSQRLTKLVVDYDELDSLQSALSYLGKLDYNVTTLPTFVASYVSKAGLRVGAYTSQKHGAIQYFLQDYSRPGARILISAYQLAQFQGLIGEARKNLDSMRAAH